MVCGEILDSLSFNRIFASVCIKTHIFSVLFCLLCVGLIAQNSTFALSFQEGSDAVFPARNRLVYSLIMNLIKN